MGLFVFWAGLWPFFYFWPPVGLEEYGRGITYQPGGPDRAAARSAGLRARGPGVFCQQPQRAVARVYRARRRSDDRRLRACEPGDLRAAGCAQPDHELLPA